MATWKNLDTLASYSKLAELKGHVNIAAIGALYFTTRSAPFSPAMASAIFT